MTMSNARPRRKVTAAVLVALAASVGAAACGSDDVPTAAAAGSGDGDAAGKRFVYVAGVTGDPAYGAVGCGAKIEAKRVGATVEQQDVTAFTAAAQTPVLNAAAAGRPDGILISPTDPAGLYAPVQSAKSRGIPVVTVVNSLNDTKPISSQVLVDNFGGGVAAAKVIAERAAGKPVKVAVITFTAGGSRAADDEWKGFEQEIKKAGSVRYLGPQFVGSGPAEATAAMNALLSRDPDLFAVFSTFGYATQGILASTRQRDKDTVIVGAYSALSDDLVAALKSGELAAIIDYPFREAGAAAVRQLVRASTGGSPEPSVSLGSVVYEKDVFDDPEKAKTLGAVSCPV